MTEQQKPTPDPEGNRIVGMFKRRKNDTLRIRAEYTGFKPISDIKPNHWENVGPEQQEQSGGREVQTYPVPGESQETRIPCGCVLAVMIGSVGAMLYLGHVLNNIFPVYHP